MYELNSQQIDSVNGGGILTGALFGLMVSGMKIGYNLTGPRGGLFSCLPCCRPSAPQPPAKPPVSQPPVSQPVPPPVSL